MNSDRNKNVVLSVRNLTHCYRRRAGLFKRLSHKALDDVSFDVYKGDILGVLGRNGCGKSSLLRILSGVVNPSAGNVECDANLRRALLALGLGFKLDLSGRDNAMLGAMLQGLSRSEAAAILEDINEFAELETFFDQPVKTYSGGMRSRLGFATAIKTEVDILLIDETLSVGDAHFRKKAEAHMMEKIAGDQTVVFVSHAHQQIEKLCNRAIWIEAGRVMAEGETAVVAKAYHDFMANLDNNQGWQQPEIVSLSSRHRAGKATGA